MDIKDAISVSASGLRAQSLRMRIIAENIANQDSVAQTPGGDPYRRRVVSFKAEVDRASGAMDVAVSRITADSSAFGREYKPGHPAADARGYVLTPNVSSLIEKADMDAALRSYEANVSAIEAARNMTSKTLDLLR